MDTPLLHDFSDDDAAFDRIDALLAQASPHSTTAELPRRDTPPVERILQAVERLMLVGSTLARSATITAGLRSALEQVLRDVAQLCDDWGFVTARARVDFTRDDLRNGYGDLGHDIAELVRHLRYDARAWQPRRAQRRYASHRPQLAIAADRS
jgi:hypothetical protein